MPPTIKPPEKVYNGDGKPPPKPGLMDQFRSKAVDIWGPSVIKALTQEFNSLRDNHSTDGRIDLQFALALDQIETRVEGMRKKISKGGAEGYHKMQEAKKYIGRLQAMGIEA